MKNKDSELIKVSDLTEDIVIITPLKLQQILATEKSWYFTKNDDLRFHEINVKYENTLLMLEIKPQDPTVHLFVYMRFGQRPTTQDYDLNATISHDEKCVWMPSAHEKSEGQAVCSLNPNATIQVLVERPGKYFFGLKNYNATVNLSHTREKDLVLVESEGSAPASSLKIHHPPYPRVKNVLVMPVYDSTTDQKNLKSGYHLVVE